MEQKAESVCHLIRARDSGSRVGRSKQRPYERNGNCRLFGCSMLAF